MLSVNTCIGGVRFDELSAWSYIIAHEHREDRISLSGIVDRDLAKRAVLRIHRGLPELLLVHFTETLVSLDTNTILISSPDTIDEGLTLLLRPAVFLLLASSAKIERWCSDVNIAVLNERTHVSEEERQDERRNVATVHVSIGHDDDLMIAELGEV